MFFVVFFIHRYGFITFENQEDADRILKKEVSVEVRIVSFSSVIMLAVLKA